MMLLAFTLGCVTAEVQMATRRGEEFAKEKAAEGDALGAAVANELQVANKLLGADKIPAEAVELTIPAAEANTEVLKEQVEQKAFFKNILPGAVDWLGGLHPGIAAAISGIGVAVALGKKLLGKAKALRAAITMTSKVKEAIKGDKKSMAKFRDIYAVAKTDGKDFVAGSKELYAEYTALKKKAEAKKT